MKLRWVLAGVLGVAGLAGLCMAVITWSVPDTGRWMFVAFAALFLVLAFAVAKPAKKPEPPPTRFVPAWFFDGAILLLTILILFAIASCLFGRK